jgi:hypothetical protein
MEVVLLSLKDPLNQAATLLLLALSEISMISDLSTSKLLISKNTEALAFLSVSTERTPPVKTLYAPLDR